MTFYLMILKRLVIDFNPGPAEPGYVLSLEQWICSVFGKSVDQDQLASEEAD